MPLSASAAAAAQAASGLPTRTTLADVRSLSRAEAARGYPVRVRATVFHFAATDWISFYVDDGTSGIWVDVSDEVLLEAHPELGVRPAAPGLGVRRAPEPGSRRDPSSAGSPPPSFGDLVEIAGVTGAGAYAPILRAKALEIVGRGRLREPARPPYHELTSGAYDSQWIEVEGIVQSQLGERVRLSGDIAVPGGMMEYALGDIPIESLPPLVDARVRMRGACSPEFTESGQMTGLGIVVSRREDIVLLQPAPEDPFALPARSLGQVLNFSVAGTSGHRVQVRGVATLARPGRFVYLQDAATGLRVESPEALPIRPGDAVAAVGFPTFVLGSRPRLVHSSLRRAGTARQPEPLHLEAEGLLAITHDARLVRVDAQLLGVSGMAASRSLTLEAGGLVFTADLELGESPSDVPRLVEGSRIRLTGVYVYSSGTPPSFRLLLRSPQDVEVIQAASWWRLRHTFVLAATLLPVLAVGGLWARSARAKNRALEGAHAGLTRAHDALEERVRERTADLESEVAERQRAEGETRQAAERAHRANAELLEQRQALQREVEERRRLEVEAGRERDLLRTLIDTIPDRIYFKDRQSRFLRVNAAEAAALHLLSSEDPVGKTDVDLRPGEFARKTLAQELDLMETGKPLLGEVSHDPRSDRWYLVTKVPTREAPGEVTGLVGISKDITDRKRAEDLLAKDLAALTAVVGEIAEGDLTRRAGEGEGTLGQIGRSVNQMLSRFSSLLGDVRDAAASVASSSAEILAAATEISKGSQYGTEQVLSTSTAVDEMAASMSQVARNAAHTAETAGSALAYVRAGTGAAQAATEGMRRIDDAVAETGAKMRQLEQRSRTVSEIIGLIEDLASESNLLALNAAIEAAHAGDAGRGFGVVAGEIRRLADRSHGATRDVTSIIEGIAEDVRTVLEAMAAAQTEVRRGQELSDRVQGSLAEVGSLVEQSAELSALISGASAEQTEATRTVADAMQTIANIAEQSAAGSRETSKAVTRLVSLSEGLEGAIGRFRISGGRRDASHERA